METRIQKLKGKYPIITFNVPEYDRFNFQVERSPDSTRLDFNKTNYIKKSNGIANGLIDTQRTWGEATPYTNADGEKYFITQYADLWDFGGNFAKDWGNPFFRLGEGTSKALEIIGTPIIFQSRKDTIPIGDFIKNGFTVTDSENKLGNMNYLRYSK